MTVLSGLPGVGKDHWIEANRPDVPVVSLDRLRAEMGVDPAGDQRAVAAAAHELARGHLRAGRSFVWNATNVSRTQRDLCTGLIAGYRGASRWSRWRRRRGCCGTATGRGRRRSRTR